MKKKILIGVFIFLFASVYLSSLKHPIVLKIISGSARNIGKPIETVVYTDGKINESIKVFYYNKHWGNNKKTDVFLLNLTETDERGLLTFIGIFPEEKWVGQPNSTNIKEYDFIFGNLFQSDVGGHFVPFHDQIKGFGFDPQLSTTKKQIKFNIPPNKLDFDSIRIELK